jgi:serine/threonine protein kinase
LARNQEYVALKVSVAEQYGKTRELETLRTLVELNSDETGSRHVMQLLDHFSIEGPNGTHECLVLEFLGPSITDVLDVGFNDERLPGKLAKTSVQQALAGLAFLHKHNIGHGGTTKYLTYFGDMSLMYRRSVHTQLGFCGSLLAHSHRTRASPEIAKTRNRGRH